MKNSPWGLWLGGAVTVVLTSVGLWFGVTNFWAYLRMRAIPVEVLQSTLRVDSPDGKHLLEHFLWLDLQTTDGSQRRIRAEDSLGQATYPEEALDELQAWAPGSRHLVYQLRGDAREIRLPGAGQSPELDAAFLALGLSLFPGFLFLMISAAMVHEETWLRQWGVQRLLGPWTVFSAVGLFMTLVLVAFLWSETPKRWSWLAVEATPEVQPELEAETSRKPLPPGVIVTPAAKAVLDRAAYRVLRFPGADGRTLHAGIGNMDGPYEALDPYCPVSAPSCRFFLNPKNRWNFEVDPRWDTKFFLPAGMFLLFSVVFSAVGWSLRREK